MDATGAGPAQWRCPWGLRPVRLPGAGGCRREAVDSIRPSPKVAPGRQERGDLLEAAEGVILSVRQQHSGSPGDTRPSVFAARTSVYPATAGPGEAAQHVLGSRLRGEAGQLDGQEVSAQLPSSSGEASSSRVTVTILLHPGAGTRLSATETGGCNRLQAAARTGCGSICREYRRCRPALQKPGLTLDIGAVDLSFEPVSRSRATGSDDACGELSQQGDLRAMNIPAVCGRVAAPICGALVAAVLSANATGVLAAPAQAPPGALPTAPSDLPQITGPYAVHFNGECLDSNSRGNAYVGVCKQSLNQEWMEYSYPTKGAFQLTDVATRFCLATSTSGGFLGYHGNAGQAITQRCNNSAEDDRELWLAMPNGNLMKANGKLKLTNLNGKLMNLHTRSLVMLQPDRTLSAPAQSPPVALPAAPSDTFQVKGPYVVHYNGECLDSNSRGNVYVGACKQSPSQKWLEYWYPTKGAFQLTDVTTRLCLAISTSVGVFNQHGNAGQAITQGCNNSAGDDRELWLAMPDANLKNMNGKLMNRRSRTLLVLQPDRTLKAVT
jgi:hypothetical protein